MTALIECVILQQTKPDTNAKLVDLYIYSYATLHTTVINDVNTAIYTYVCMHSCTQLYYIQGTFDEDVLTGWTSDQNEQYALSRSHN